MLTKTSPFAGHLVVEFDSPRRIGEAILPSPSRFLSDHRGCLRPQPPMKILGEATYENWIEGIVSAGGPQPPPPGTAGRFFYYFVSVD